MMRRLSRVAATLLVICLAAQVALLVRYRSDQHRLEEILDRIVSASLPPSEQAKAILMVFKNQPDRENDSSFLLPVFSTLRATPLEVAISGGDCADRSRLVVTMLELRGIRASKWALHDADGVPRHAVVEAQVETGPMVLDPLFYLWFPRPHGGYYGIEDLKRDPSIVPSRLAEFPPQESTPYGDPLRGYPTDEYTYEHPRTINWNKSFVFRTVYRALHVLLGPNSDRIPRPRIAEQPALILIVLVGMLEFSILAAWAMLRRPGGNRAAATMNRTRGWRGPAADTPLTTTDPLPKDVGGDRKLLVVTYHFPPDGAIGGLRWAGFTKYLAPLGWESVVVTAASQADPYFARGVTVACAAPLPTLNELYRRVRSRLTETPIPEETSMEATPMGMGSSKFAGARSLQWIRQEAAMLPVIPDHGRGWILRAATRTRSLIRAWRPDVVISSGPPHSAHFATWLATRGSRPRWIADLRDPWTAPLTEAWLATSMHKSWISRQSMQAMERTVFGAVSEVIVNSRSLADALRRKYPSVRVTWLPNGFDLDSVPKDVGEPFPGLGITHLGTLYGERDLTPILDALRELLRKNPAAHHDGTKLRIAGALEGASESELRRAIRERELQSHVEIRGLLPRAEALRILARSRLCVVLAQGQVVEVPGKLYESIAMGIPTVVLAPRDSASATEASRVGGSFIEQTDSKALAALFQAAFDGTLVGQSGAQSEIDYGGVARDLNTLLRN